jgi:hypothetical protein
MQIPKEMIVERIRAQADAETASRAEAQLPEKVDTDRDADLLRKFDIDAADLAGDLPHDPNVG